MNTILSTALKSLASALLSLSLACSRSATVTKISRIHSNDAQSFNHLFFKITANSFTLLASASTLLILNIKSVSVLLPLTLISDSAFMSGGCDFFTADYPGRNCASACLITGSMRLGDSSLSSVYSLTTSFAFVTSYSLWFSMCSISVRYSNPLRRTYSARVVGFQSTQFCNKTFSPSIWFKEHSESVLDISLKSKTVNLYWFFSS